MIAGNSMMPTTISVPSAWKPPTRFITTSTRKRKWVGELKRLTEAQELRVEAFEHERPVDDGERRHGETVAMPAIRISAASSSASTVPNSTCNRSMLLPFIETISTPSASETR